MMITVIDDDVVVEVKTGTKMRDERHDVRIDVRRSRRIVKLENSAKICQDTPRRSLMLTETVAAHRSTVEISPVNKAGFRDRLR